MTKTRLQQLTDEYIDTRMAYDIAHAASSDADKAHKAVRKQLVDVMLEVSRTIDNDEIHEGMRFRLRNQFSVKCNKDNEEQVKDWLHDRYGDLEEFTTQKVQKTTVEERLKADIEGGKLDEFDVPDFMDLKTRPDITCDGWKAYSLNQRSET